AAAHGLWSDEKFLEQTGTPEFNKQLKTTQFADFHGHGWVYRGVYAHDRKGNWLDREGKQIAFDDPERFGKAVHLADIHLEKGMQCTDCHFGQDNHGNGKIYGEPRAAVEILPVFPNDETMLAHANSSMTCYACHTSWTPTCFGCHLQMTANVKRPMLHNEGITTRNYTSYNFQVLRDDIYMLGVDGTATGHRIAPARSSCAILVSSQTANREWLYYQQQSISAPGFSGEAYSTFVPHTVRAKETKQCTDC